MPLQPLSVPEQSNSFVTAVTLCVLLPTLNDDNLFDVTIVRLFGNEITRRQTTNIMNELDHAHLKQFPTLITLIQSHLRPRLVAHVNSRSEEYQLLFESQELFRERVALLAHAQAPADAFEQTVLSNYLSIEIEVIQSLYPELRNPGPIPILYFSIREGVYHYFVESDALSDTLRSALFPIAPIATPQVVDLVRFQQAKSTKLLQHMFTSASDENMHLDNISKNADIMKPTDSALSPADVKFVLRFNLENELRVLRAVVDQVQLTGGYDIVLVPREGCTQQKIIYAVIGETGFDYTICGETGATTTAFLEYREIETEEARFQYPVTIEQLKRFLPKIQEKLEERNHIVVVKVEIGGTWSWARSMGYSGGVGLTVGTAAVGAVTMGEIAGAGIGIALIPYAGIPLAIAFLGAIMGASYWGKKWAVEYEKTLDTVNQLLSQGLYDQASELLEQQLNKWTLGTRELFLTKQHETLMHFFVALCARKMGNLQKAYENFVLTYNAARSIDKKSAAFIAKLQLLELLKNSPPEQIFTIKVSESIFSYAKDKALNRQAEAEKIIAELTTEFTEGFTEYYWYIIGKLKDWSVRFKSLQRLSEADMVIDRRNIIEEANLFLIARDFYILKAYADGYGAFLEVLSTFYQGAILDHFGHVNPDYLDVNVRNMLIAELLDGNAPQRNVERTLALKKFESTSILLRNYKKKYPAMVQNRAIAATIGFIESFILKYYATWVDNRSLRVEAFLNIANTLDRELQISNGLYEEIKFPIDFLAMIQRDFGLVFEDEETWLDELLREPSQIAHLVSARTGDTMLHLLVRFQTGDPRLATKLKSAVIKLQEYRYCRNQNHATPLIALKTMDKHALGSVLYSEVITVGNAVGQVDEFLRNLHRNPARSKHFILLEGPPGTGKTETVLGYLGAQSYIVKKWSGPDKESKWVGQFQAKVAEFFETTKMEARKNPLKKYILFVDEINSLCQEREGNPENGTFNIRDIAEEFQQQVDTLMPMGNICLVGTTNFPELVARGMISRAKRIIYDLPSLEDRTKLLQHFFRDKRISNVNIRKMAELTQGWSIRSLQDIVSSVESDTIDIDDELLNQIFADRSRVLQNDFARQFNHHAELTLPVLRHRRGDIFEGFSVVSDAIREKFTLLSNFLEDPRLYFSQEGQLRLHILLWGPPGGGKTTSMRKFTKNTNTAFVIIKAGITLQEINALFLKVENYSSVVVCIDEIDKIAFDGSPVRELLQEKMDGMQQNNIVVIGATNYKNRIPAPLLDRFEEAYVAPFSAEQRGQLLLSELRHQLNDNPSFQADAELQTEIENHCLGLSELAGGISIRSITRKLGYYFGNLRRQQQETPDNTIPIRLDNIRELFQSLRTELAYPGRVFGGTDPMNRGPGVGINHTKSTIVPEFH